MDALRKFIDASDLHEDIGVNYEKDLKYWETQKTKCHV
jgi:hypothetical protein